MGHYKRLLGGFHSLFRVGVCVHHCIEKRQVGFPTQHVYALKPFHAHKHTLNQIIVIHLHPWGAAKADRDICISNSPHHRRHYIPSPCQLGPPGPRQRQYRKSFTHTYTIIQTVSNQFDANVKQSSSLR